jgi:hypothetical protein
MKTATTILLVFLFTTAFGQANNYQVLLDSAKTLFHGEKGLTQEELDKFDYQQVVSLLEKVIALNPQNPEARYFLGYTYSRINSRDGRGMIGMNLDWVYQCSAQFEEVIRLTPKYTGEIVALDPYSKLTGEWGSLAMKYWYDNEADSAIWAFREGKTRGGFGNFMLALNRHVLDACSPNAILVSSGDNCSIPLWYLQIVENYRPDVSVVDISLLNTTWYPAFLSKTKSVSFDLANEVLDTIEYTRWADSAITIGDFSWTVKPSYYDQYLLRGDRVFLSLLKENKFKRELYFTLGFLPESRLSLNDYLVPVVFAEKLSLFGKSRLTDKTYKEAISKALQLSSQLNLNSQDEARMFDNLRYAVLYEISRSLESGDKKNAKEFLYLLDKFAHEKKYPYLDENVLKIIERFRQQL